LTNRASRAREKVSFPPSARTRIHSSTSAAFGKELNIYRVKQLQQLPYMRLGLDDVDDERAILLAEGVEGDVWGKKVICCCGRERWSWGRSERLRVVFWSCVVVMLMISVARRSRMVRRRRREEGGLAKSIDRTGAERKGAWKIVSSGTLVSGENKEGVLLRSSSKVEEAREHMRRGRSLREEQFRTSSSRCPAERACCESIDEEQTDVFGWILHGLGL
jgi:hypothetical protein